MKNRYCTSSTVLEIGRGFVTDLTVSANGADATAELFDGKNDQGSPIATVIAKNGVTSSVVFRTYPRFDSALYVKINASTSLVNIGWRGKNEDN